MPYNTWWVTRPRRYLNPIPEAIKIFANYVGEEWLTGSAVQFDFEDELAKAGGVHLHMSLIEKIKRAPPLSSTRTNIPILIFIDKEKKWIIKLKKTIFY